MRRQAATMEKRVYEPSTEDSAVAAPTEIESVGAQ